MSTSAVVRVYVCVCARASMLWAYWTTVALDPTATQYNPRSTLSKMVPLFSDGTIDLVGREGRENRGACVRGLACVGGWVGRARSSSGSGSHLGHAAREHDAKHENAQADHHGQQLELLGDVRFRWARVGLRWHEGVGRHRS